MAADFRRGGVHPNIVLVGACPGEAEEREERPFQGEAGRGLENMIRVLSEEHPGIFPSPNRDAYSMMNAHDLPRYAGHEGYDGKRVPTKGQVMEEGNQNRIKGYLAEMEPTIIVYFGCAAEYIDPIVEQSFPGARVFRAGHPSKQAWNTKPDYRGLPQDIKVERWARDTFKPFLRG